MKQLFGKTARLTLSDVIFLWRARDASWSKQPRMYRQLAEEAIRMGEPLLGYDIATEGLLSNNDDARLRELQGLALARSGAPERAIQILKPLRRDSSRSSEIPGILARAYKDLADRAPLGSRSYRKYLRSAADTYYEAFQRTRQYWTGINAATTALLLDRRSVARRIARTLIAQCKRRLAKSRDDSYWLFATIAEAYLVVDNPTEAVSWYSRAAEAGQGRLGDLASTRRNARLILRHLGREEPAIEAAFAPPQIVVFAGHMIDSSHRAVPRFPASLEQEISGRVTRELESFRAQIGYSSAACGADILFVEAMLQRSAEVTIVLPTEPAVFRRESVEVPGVRNSWSERFDSVLARVSRVVIASGASREASPTLLSYTNELLLGMSVLRARQFDTSPRALAVWDERPGDGRGGTASAVRAWRRNGLEVSVLNPVRLATNRVTNRKAPRPKTRGKVAGLPEMKVRALLFGDAVGFSKLTEMQVAGFTREVLGRIAKLADRSKGILSRNTWGDGIFFVLRQPQDATSLALDIAELVTATRWSAMQLPEGLSFRLALHAGPVFEFLDPVIGRRSFSGTHISRAARIEPITPPGQVYASEAFACLAVAAGAKHVAFDYAGLTPLAKGYGAFPTYHVRRLG